MKRFLTAAITMMLLAGPASAQQGDRIAVVVNEEAITLKDLDQRVRLALGMSRLPDNVDNRRRIVPQVVRKMVDERLQMQEATRLKITVTPREVDAGIDNIEKANKMPKGALLRDIAKGGIDPESVRSQLTADFTWQRVAQSVLQPRIKVGEDEVQDRLETIRGQLGKPEYQLVEIFLPVDRPDQDEPMHALGERLLDQLGKGAPFGMLAGQFSQSPTAANAGNMGWISDGMLEDELMASVKSLSAGQISPLLRSQSGYFILGLVAQRIAGASTNAADAMLVVAKMILPVPKDGPSKAELMEKAAQMTQGIPNCESFEGYAKRIGATHIERIGPMKAGELPPALRRSADVPEGSVGIPTEVPEGILVPMICSRQAGPVTTSLPSPQQVRQALEAERLDMMARRYLRDLQRSAFIDVRL